MPVFKDIREILKLPIKSIEGSEVTLRNGLLAGDMAFVYGDATTNDVERALRSLSVMIVDWNLTDEKGEKIPVSLENIKKMDITDITELISATSFGTVDKKKQDLKE